MSLEKEIADLKEEVGERDDTIRELRYKIDELEDLIEETPSLPHTLSGYEEIQFLTTGNIADEDMIEALGEALVFYDSFEIASILRLLAKKK